MLPRRDLIVLTYEMHLMEQAMSTAADIITAFEQYGLLILKYVHVRIGRERATAEDLTQDIFLKVWKHRADFDPRRSSLKSWIFVIAINTITDYYRTLKPIEALDEAIPIQDKSPVEEYEKKDAVRFVLGKVHQLPPPDQELLTLRYVSDLSIKEVARIIGKKPSAVKVAIHRAVVKLRGLCHE
jgi:RNA polymerase sigma-70 factor (ECF subfamily)